MNIAVKIVVHVGRPPLRVHRISLPAITSCLVRQCVSTVGIAPYLTSTYWSGPPKNDPPWLIASRYTITLTTTSPTVPAGNRSVGMLSFSGITGRGSLGPWRVSYARWAGAPTALSSHG